MVLRMLGFGRRHRPDSERLEDFTWVASGLDPQPFVAVQLAGTRPVRVMICETQNEARDFVDRVRGDTVAASSLLLEAICRALTDDVNGAANKFYAWIQDEQAQSRTHVRTFAPDAHPFDNFAGYPVFIVASETTHDSSDAVKRATRLDEMFTAYASTPGNDRARACITQAAAGALSRYFREHGDIERADGYRAFNPFGSREVRDRLPRADMVEPLHGESLGGTALIDRVTRTGQPLVSFVLQIGANRRIVRCETQEFQKEFLSVVADLGTLPSALISGIVSALNGEFYDASTEFFDWVEGGDTGCRTEIFFPVRGVLRYPIFSVDGASPAEGTALQRGALLSKLFETYDAADGNDATRWRLIEALALGLAKHLGGLEDWGAAMRAIESGLKYSPKSIHLRAAEFALECKLHDREVPPRLVKFIGRDNGALLDRICHEPFKRFDIGPSGDVLACCGHWLPTPIGNVLNQDTGDILNSVRAQKIRASMLDGSYKYCNHLECALMIRDVLPEKEKVEDEVLRAAIEDGELKIPKASEILFAFDQTCNLSCPSCRRAQIVEAPILTSAKTVAIEQKLVPLLKDLKVLHINPAGEAFASKPSRRVLELVNREMCPELQIEIISNGMLLNEREWEKFPNLVGMVRKIRISTDAATKPTFERLRRLANWETFVDNMNFLGRLRKEGVVPNLAFSFTYQFDNFREMIPFVDFVKGFNGDIVIFERLQNLGAFTWEEFRERAVHLSGHPLRGEFLEIARDPVFSRPDVWHDFE
jgi:hypothetical protein